MWHKPPVCFQITIPIGKLEVLFFFFLKKYAETFRLFSTLIRFVKITTNGIETADKIHIFYNAFYAFYKKRLVFFYYHDNSTKL